MEANNGRRDEIQGAGVEEQAAHDACDMHDASLLDELYNLVVETDNQEQGELSVILLSTSTSTVHLYINRPPLHQPHAEVPGKHYRRTHLTLVPTIMWCLAAERREQQQNTRVP